MAQTTFKSAWTSREQGPGGPPYINFTEDDDVGMMVVQGRMKAAPGETYGRDFMVEIPKDEFYAMVREGLIT